VIDFVRWRFTRRVSLPRPEPVHPPKMRYKNRRQSGIQNGVWRLSKNGGILRLLPEARIGFELPVAREIAEACRRREQTVGRWTRHLAPWRSSESDGPSVGAYVFNRPASFASVTGPVAALCQRVGPDLWPLTARTVFQPLKPSSPPQPFRAVWRSGPPKVNARKTNAVGGPAAAVSTQRRIEPQAAATGRCMSRPAPRAASDWRAA
jgi:hypothetical protein